MQDVTLRLQHLEPDNVIRFFGHPTHVHDVPHLIYVVVGTAHLTVDGVRMTLGPHESVWLAAGVPHAAQYDRGSLVLGPFLEAQDAPGRRVVKLPATPEITSLMTTVLGVAPRTPEQVAPLRRAIGDALRALFTCHFTLVAPRHPGVTRLARKAATSTQTLAQLAAEHALSARQVQRVFLRETGMSFQQWRVRARLNVAIAHLRGGESVASAALRVGYETRSGLVKALEREVAAHDLEEILGRTSPTR